MDEHVENIMLEHLKAIRGDLSRLNDKVDDLSALQLNMKQHMARFLGQETLQDTKIAEMETRLERIEKRLELAD